MGTLPSHPFFLSLRFIANTIKLIYFALQPWEKIILLLTPFDFSIKHDSTDLDLDVRAYRRFASTSHRFSWIITKDIT